MPYDEVQEIDSVYRQQGYLHEEMTEYVRSIYHFRQTLTGGYTLADLSPQQMPAP